MTPYSQKVLLWIVLGLSPIQVSSCFIWHPTKLGLLGHLGFMGNVVQNLLFLQQLVFVFIYTNFWPPELRF